MRRTSALLATALLLAACGVPDEKAQPGGPEGVLLSVKDIGGFVPIEWNLRRGPSYTLTTDGRLISEGATPAIYPGPLLPYYYAVQLTDAKMEELLEMVDDMGLPGITDEHDDSANAVIADASTAVITYWDSNGTHRYSAYALGFDFGGVTPRHASKVFAEIREHLGELVAGHDPLPYQPTRVQVLVGVGTIDRDFEDVRPWPFYNTDFSSWTSVGFDFSCMTFGPEVLARFGDATQATLWTNPGEGPDELNLYVRALHPGEPDCPFLD